MRQTISTQYSIVVQIINYLRLSLTCYNLYLTSRYYGNVTVMIIKETSK